MGEHIDVTTIAEASDPASHKHDSRREIIEAAAQCFMLKGLDKATMDDIAFPVQECDLFCRVPTGDAILL